MGREIRITIDDDEVFERMKARKRELDLSWREVLHRGLWGDAGPGPDPTGHGSGPSREPFDDDFGDRIERQIKRRVEDSLQTAFGIDDERSGPPGGGLAPHAPSGGHGPGVEDLENAEDAVLRFPFLDHAEDPEYEVPLRVNLETTADGLDVEVVAVRQGKNVRGMNAFDRSARMGIAQGFSRGASATLELGDGEEEYSVSATLSWGRDGEGNPTVVEVAIEEVTFDE